MKIVNVGMTDAEGNLVLALTGDMKPDCIVVVIEKDDGETTADIVEKINRTWG